MFHPGLAIPLPREKVEAPKYSEFCWGVLQHTDSWHEKRSGLKNMQLLDPRNICSILSNIYICFFSFHVPMVLQQCCSKKFTAFHRWSLEALRSLALAIIYGDFYRVFVLSLAVSQRWEFFSLRLFTNWGKHPKPTKLNKIC